jgi:hypothetical protein
MKIRKGDRFICQMNLENGLREIIISAISKSKKYIKVNQDWISMEDFKNRYKLLERLPKTRSL